MRFLTIHLKDRNGNLVDYMTSEKTLKQLTAKYEMVIGYLAKQGFTQVSSMDVLKPTPKPLETATSVQERHCAVCGNLMEFKQGMSKTRKPWKGYFCSERSHEPQWVK